jgi:uncharacterized phage-associated protein
MASNNIPTSAQVVAEYFLWFSNQTGSFISNLKLQKLLYYAQGWHLALHKERLFKDKMEAWVHGPAIPKLYGLYKKFSYNPIVVAVGKPDVAPEMEKFCQEIAKVFFPMDAYYLELATHQEPPWLNARKGLPPHASCKNPISESDMLKYFSGLAQNAAKN